MNKLIFSSSLACVLFLLLGTYIFPSNSIMWFVNMSVPFTIFRIIMVGLLVAVLVTTPPRHMYMRVLMGLMAITLVAAGVWMALAGSLHLLDIVVFLLLGTTFGIEALEFNEDELDARIMELREQYDWQQFAAAFELPRLQAVPSLFADRFIYFPINVERATS